MQSPAVPTGSTPAESEEALIATVLGIARRAARQMMPRDAADDVAQDVAVAFFNKLSPERRASSSPLEAVVRHMVRQRAIDHGRQERRRKRRESTYTLEVRAASHSWMEPDAIVEEEELEALRGAILRELPDRCRAAFTIVRDEETPYAEAGKRLGVRRGSVCRLIVGAQRVFRRRLSAEGIVVPGRVSCRQATVASAPGR